MSQGTESTTYRRAKYLEEKRLGLPLPAAPPPAPSKPLSCEFRRALQLQARRLNLPEPKFDREGREIPAQAAGPSYDPWAGAGLPSSLKRVDAAPAPTNAQPSANAAPDTKLSAVDRRAMYLSDVKRIYGEGGRLPEGVTWSESISRTNLK